MSQSFTFVPRPTNNSRSRENRRPNHSVSLADFVVSSGEKVGIKIPENKSTKLPNYKYREQPVRKPRKKVTFQVSTPETNKVKKVPDAPKKASLDLKMEKSVIKQRRGGKPPLHPKVTAVRNIEDSLAMEKAVMLRNTIRRISDIEKELTTTKEINNELMCNLCECCAEMDLWRDLQDKSAAYIYQLELVSQLYNALVSQGRMIAGSNKKPVMKFSPDGFISIVGEEIKD